MNSSDNPAADSTDETGSPESKKKTKSNTAHTVNPVQYRAVRYVSFMLEDTKYDVTPEDFLKQAIARHLALYQTKRGIEFPTKMLAELIKLNLIPSKGSLEE